MDRETYETASAWIDAEADRREAQLPSYAGHEPMILWTERMTDALDACYTGDTGEAEEACYSLDADPPPGYMDEDLVVVSGWLEGEHHGEVVTKAVGKGQQA